MADRERFRFLPQFPGLWATLAAFDPKPRFDPVAIAPREQQPKTLGLRAVQASEHCRLAVKGRS